MSLQIETLATATLTPYARNARTHSPEQVRQIAASITEFGFTNPILIDGEGGIIAGHGRVMAAQSLGLEQVPCLRLGHLTEAQKRAYILADNQLALNAGWDESLLSLELTELQELDVDLGLIGFDAAELDRLLEMTNPPPPDDGSTDDVPELQPVAISQPGDVWLLGNHRLMCGDSTDTSMVQKLLGGGLTPSYGH
jgi:ParB-like chromosome segregation protein Spo0J